MAGGGMTWLITGVSSGLGRALAEAALARGDAVAGLLRRPDALAAFEALAPGRAHALLADLGDEAAVLAAVRRAEGLLGQVDVLVNNAGYGLTGAVEEASAEEIRRQFETNLYGPLATIRAVLPAMRVRRGGHIVNITSVSGLAAWAGTGIYCASKYALEAIGETLAQELGPLGIKVTNVAPGGLRTDYAGRSLTRTAARIDDYGATAHESFRLLTAGAGRERGDPARAAVAIMAAVDAPAPPLHLLLGGDAVHYATRKLGALQTEMGEWIDLTLSTAFPQGSPG